MPTWEDAAALQLLLSRRGSRMREDLAVVSAETETLPATMKWVVSLAQCSSPWGPRVAALCTQWFALSGDGLWPLGDRQAPPDPYRPQAGRNRSASSSSRSPV